MTMAMPHIVCNHCEDVILDVHSCTIYEGTIYHWLCLEQMREEGETKHEPDSFGGEPSVYKVRKDSLGLEFPRLRRCLNWLFRRKT